MPRIHSRPLQGAVDIHHAQPLVFRREKSQYLGLLDCCQRAVAAWPLRQKWVVRPGAENLEKTHVVLAVRTMLG